MGYRNYIASIPRDEYNKIKNFTKEELYIYKKTDIEDDYVGVWEIAHNRLYELGKYVDMFPKKLFKPFFIDKKLQKYYTEDGELYIVGKKFLENVIESYSLKIRNYYLDMLNPFYDNNKINCEFLKSVKTEYGYEKNKYKFDFSKITQEQETSIYNMINHIKGMASEWGVNSISDGHRPYDLKGKDEVTTSWKYEYVQFELVRIYKTFNWKNNVMVYYGH